ncbi:hypothetical protein DFH09DRAFT_1440871 [Mycena vulgaris]|nr:hypothetical protein DFH09DRAFT_1440871 [Mycena vulgaris]
MQCELKILHLRGTPFDSGSSHEFPLFLKLFIVVLLFFPFRLALGVSTIRSRPTGAHPSAHDDATYSETQLEEFNVVQVLTTENNAQGRSGAHLEQLRIHSEYPSQIQPPNRQNKARERNGIAVRPGLEPFIPLPDFLLLLTQPRVVYPQNVQVILKSTAVPPASQYQAQQDQDRLARGQMTQQDVPSAGGPRPSVRPAHPPPPQVAHTSGCSMQAVKLESGHIPARWITEVSQYSGIRNGARLSAIRSPSAARACDTTRQLVRFCIVIGVEEALQSSEPLGFGIGSAVLAIGKGIGVETYGTRGDRSRAEPRLVCSKWMKLQSVHIGALCPGVSDTARTASHLAPHPRYARASSPGGRSRRHAHTRQRTSAASVAQERLSPQRAHIPSSASPPALTSARPHPRPPRSPEPETPAPAPRRRAPPALANAYLELEVLQEPPLARLASTPTSGARHVARWCTDAERPRSARLHDAALHWGCGAPRSSLPAHAPATAEHSTPRTSTTPRTMCSTAPRTTSPTLARTQHSPRCRARLTPVPPTSTTPHLRSAKRAGACIRAASACHVTSDSRPDRRPPRARFMPPLSGAEYIPAHPRLALRNTYTPTPPARARPSRERRAGSWRKNIGLREAWPAGGLRIRGREPRKWRVRTVGVISVCGCGWGRGRREGGREGGSKRRKRGGEIGGDKGARDEGGGAGAGTEDGWRDCEIREGEVEDVREQGRAGGRVEKRKGVSTEISRTERKGRGRGGRDEGQEKLDVNEMGNETTGRTGERLRWGEATDGRGRRRGRRRWLTSNEDGGGKRGRDAGEGVNGRAERSKCAVASNGIISVQRASGDERGQHLDAWRDGKGRVSMKKGRKARRRKHTLVPNVHARCAAYVSRGSGKVMKKGKKNAGEADECERHMLRARPDIHRSPSAS